MKKNDIKRHQKYRLYICCVVCVFCGYFEKAGCGFILIFLHTILCLMEEGFKD